MCMWHRRIASPIGYAPSSDCSPGGRVAMIASTNGAPLRSKYVCVTPTLISSMVTS
jgi:hypothetical protein